MFLLSETITPFSHINVYRASTAMWHRDALSVPLIRLPGGDVFYSLCVFLYLFSFFLTYYFFNVYITSFDEADEILRSINDRYVEQLAEKITGV